MCPYSTLFLFPYTRVCKKNAYVSKTKIKKGTPLFYNMCIHTFLCMYNVRKKHKQYMRAFIMSCNVKVRIWRIVYRVSCIVYRVSCIVYLASYIVYRVSCIVYLVSCIVYRVTCIDRRNCPQFHVMGFIFNVVLLF